MKVKKLTSEFNILKAKHNDNKTILQTLSEKLKYNCSKLGMEKEIFLNGGANYNKFFEALIEKQRVNVDLVSNMVDSLTDSLHFIILFDPLSKEVN